MDIVAVVIFLVALGVIAFEWVHRTKVALTEAALMVLLRAVFPRYLGDLRHTAFLANDSELLDERAKTVRSEPTKMFARVVARLDANESETHAAERFLHTGKQAFAVVDGERFLGMLSVAALCDARLGRRGDVG